MLQPAFSDCLFLDLLSHLQDLRAAAVIDVGGGQVVQVLVVAMVVVVIDERPDLAFQVAGQEVVFQEDTVLHGLVPAFDLALGLWMVRRTANVIHALVLEISGKIRGDVRRAIVAEQPRFLNDRRVVAARRLQRQFQRVGDVHSLYRGAGLPGDDVAAVVVEDGAEIEPAPTDDLQVREVSLPELVWSLNSSAAQITTWAGAVIRSSALRKRYTDASETK